MIAPRPAMGAHPQSVGPGRRVLRELAPRIQPSGQYLYPYVLECGHEVVRGMPRRQRCFCDVCVRAEVRP